jgi:uncharacterized membrane-anchored protein YitT (DUF2179 family)
MNRQQIIQYHPQLKRLLSRLRSLNLSLIIVVIILYSVSVYCLLIEQTIIAISLASVAAILFHLSQKHIVTIVKYWLYQDKKNRAMLTFLEQEMASKVKNTKEMKAFFALLETAMQMVDGKTDST